MFNNRPLKKNKFVNTFNDFFFIFSLFICVCVFLLFVVLLVGFFFVFSFVGILINSWVNSFKTVNANTLIHDFSMDFL